MSRVPRAEAGDWEDLQGFRETLLHHVTDPGANRAMRELGQWVYVLALQATWDRAKPRAVRESTTRRELQAALVDLRALQGFLTQVGNERDESELSLADERLSRLGARLALTLAELGDELEGQLYPKPRSRPTAPAVGGAPAPQQSTGRFDTGKNSPQKK